MAETGVAGVAAVAAAAGVSGGGLQALSRSAELWVLTQQLGKIASPALHSRHRETPIRPPPSHRRIGVSPFTSPRVQSERRLGCEPLHQGVDP